jgi:hypothetical protein
VNDHRHLALVDHLVYAGPHLPTSIDVVRNLLGVEPSAGGQHPGRGTRNALVALGPATYLEIIGPDPDQPEPTESRPFGIDQLDKPRLVTWAAKERDLSTLRAKAASAGIVLGELGEGSRQRPDGQLLRWRYTNPRTVIADGIVPFFIDWGTSPQPAGDAVAGGLLVELRAEHPDPTGTSSLLRSLQIDLPLSLGTTPRLIATIETPWGPVDLR